MTGKPVIVVVTDHARKAVEELGSEAVQAVERLRAELEVNPRLGLPRGARGPAEVYRTRIELGARSGLSIAYVFTPEPPPPTAAITSVVPDEEPDPGP